MKGGLTVDKDINSTTIQNFVGLAALVELLADKGVITEAEYEAKFEEAKKIVMDSVIEEMKKKMWE